MEFVTLTKKDPQFKKYLWGTFAPGQRAVAMETFDPFSNRERVTFRVQPVETIVTPPWWKVYLLSARPEMWLLSLGPALAALFLLRGDLQWSEWLPAGGALLALFFMHNAACLANDVQDHLTGSDRANRRRGSQVIQKGWSSAWSMALWALVNLALACVVGLPALGANPFPLVLVAGGAVAAIALLLSARGARAGLSDLCVAMLYGPLIVLGMAAAVGRTWSFEFGLVGVNFGWLSMWVLQARQLENLFRSQRESHRTFVGFLDFDWVKRVFILEGLAVLGLTVYAAVDLIQSGPAWALLPFASLPLAFVLQKVSRAVSPLSSDFVRIGRYALIAHASLTVWWWVSLALL